MNQVKGSMRANTNTGINLSKVLFWFVTIDLFFLPYFRFMSLTISIPIMTIWVVLHFKNYFRGKEAYMMLLLLVTMVSSTAIGLLWDSSSLRIETDIRTTILRFFQYFLCFGYYFYFKNYFSKNKVDLSKVIFVFTVYLAVFAILFMLFPRQFAEIKIILNPADNHTRRYLAGQVSYRFNYFWTDPNNVAYLLDSLVFFYVLDDKNSMKKKLMVIVLALISILATASNGGSIILAFVFAYLAIKWILDGGRIKIKSIRTIIGAILIFFMIIYFTNLGSYINENLVTKVVLRYKLYKTSSNLSGGRIADFKESLKYINPLFLFIGSGKEGFTLENGHIYWICMYGVPSYLAFMYIVFGKFREIKWTRYVWVIPFFFGFTVNIGIGEFKWMGILLMLVAYSRYSDVTNTDRIWADIN